MSIFLLSLFFALMVTDSFAVSTDELRYYSTRDSIGIEWDVSDDSNHTATCQVSFRQSGSAIWQEAMPLFRIDFNGENMMAGSIFSLAAGTSYDIKLDLTDLDGGDTSQTFSLATLSQPSVSTSGRTFYVIPGDGGGSGSKASPFMGIAAAQQEVKAGDIVFIGAGSYTGETEFNVAGEENNYIVWKGTGDGKTVFETIRVSASHIWLEGLLVKGNTYGLRTYSSPENVVINRNSFSGCNYCIYLNHGGTAWYISNNTIVGNVAPDSGDFGGEGIELNHSDGHTVSYNRISRVADGVSYPGSNCDIFGNEIFDVSDDGIEPDYGYANNRIWANRISNAYHNGISFQPMNGAPWYIFRNQVAAPVESALKFRSPVDRALIAHNTFVGWSGVQSYGSEALLAVQSNNNLWISMTDSYVWENGSGGLRDWRTNLDYDGFDWGTNEYAIKWGTRYTDLSSFSAATGGLEQHGIRINKDSCFTSIDIPSPPPASMPFQYFSLKPDCNAVDHGIVLPNINDDFLGLGPDLGAYEFDASLPHYGPRSETLDPHKSNRRVLPSLQLLLLQ